MQEGFLVLNAHGNVVHCNDMAAEFFGLTKSELLSQSADSVMAKAVYEDGTPIPLSDLPCKRVLRTGEAEISVFLGLPSTGEKMRWLRSNALPFKMKYQGEQVAVLNTYIDVTNEIEESKRLAFSEKRLNEAQAVAKIGSWSFDLSTMKIDWTVQLFELFPFPNRIEPSFEELKKVIHPEDFPAWELAVTRCMQEAVPYTIRHRVIHPDKILWMEAIGLAAQDASGKVIGLYGTCQNITEKVQLEEDNQFITSSLKLGIWKFNPISNDLVWDKSMYSVFGINEKDFSGSYDAWEKTLTPDSKAAAVEELGRALRGEKEFDTTFKIRTNTGEIRYIGGRAIVKRGPNGEAVMMYGVNWDKTSEMVLLESLDLEKAKSLHTAKLASLGEMSASIAHEINNPLAIISGYLSMLEASKDQPEKFRAKTDVIQKAVERIAKIVNGLRKFSRTTEIKNYSEHRLCKIVDEALTLTASKAKKYAVPISLDLNSDASILCDEVEIEQVLVNLIGNAIDAVKNTPDCWVKIMILEDADAIFLRVVDSGPGIDNKIIARIFDPFYTTKSIGEGTGLGLSIVKGILDEHKAQIQVLTAMKNTCFEIRFRKLSKKSGA